MFENFTDRWKLTNETMGKLLDYLKVPTDWLYDGDLTYTHKESGIKISWGRQHSYDSSYKWRHISEPVRIRIPFRFRKPVWKQIKKIQDRHRKPSDDLSFLNDYMSGLYRLKTTIPNDQKSEITAWMLTNGIYEWHIIGDTIWFKNEEDAVAAKLRWTE